jgi:cell wall-associated NlpC family hydrolase
MGIRIAETAKTYHGTYQLGADGPDKYDCSGVIKKAAMANGIPDPTEGPSDSRCVNMWKNQIPVDNPREGDLAFFDTDHSQDKNGEHLPNHCAVVTGVAKDGEVTIYGSNVHGGPENKGGPQPGVIKPGGYWAKYLMGYRRLKPLPMPNPTPTPTPNTCPLPPKPSEGCDFGPDYPKHVY